MRKYKSDYSRTAYLISRCTKSWSWHEHISYLFRIFAQANENTVSVFTKMWAKTENSEEKILFFRKYCHPNFKYLQPLHTDYHIKACKHQAFFSTGHPGLPHVVAHWRRQRLRSRDLFGLLLFQRKQDSNTVHIFQNSVRVQIVHMQRCQKVEIFFFVFLLFPIHYSFQMFLPASSYANILCTFWMLLLGLRNLLHTIFLSRQQS